MYLCIFMYKYHNRLNQGPTFARSFYLLNVENTEYIVIALGNKIHIQYIAQEQPIREFL